MYRDSPPDKAAVSQVIVIEKGDCDAEAIIKEARDAGASRVDWGFEGFYVVFSDDPTRVWDMTERCLAEEIDRRQRKGQRELPDQSGNAYGEGSKRGPTFPGE